MNKYPYHTFSCGAQSTLVNMRNWGKILVLRMFVQGAIVPS